MASPVPSLVMPVPNGASSLPALAGAPDFAAPRLLPAARRPGGEQDPVDSFAGVLARVAQMAGRVNGSGDAGAKKAAALPPADGPVEREALAGPSPDRPADAGSEAALESPELVARALWLLIRRLLSAGAAGGVPDAGSATAGGGLKAADPMARLVQLAQALAGPGALSSAEPVAGAPVPAGLQGPAGTGDLAGSYDYVPDGQLPGRPLSAAAQVAGALAALLARLVSQVAPPAAAGSSGSEEASPERVLARLLASDAEALPVAALIIEAGQSLGLLEAGDLAGDVAGAAGAPPVTNGSVLDAVSPEPAVPGSTPGLTDGQALRVMPRTSGLAPALGADAQAPGAAEQTVLPAALTGGRPGDAPAVALLDQGGDLQAQSLREPASESQGAGTPSPGLDGRAPAPPEPAAGAGPRPVPGPPRSVVGSAAADSPVAASAAASGRERAGAGGPEHPAPAVAASAAARVAGSAAGGQAGQAAADGGADQETPPALGARGSTLAGGMPARSDGAGPAAPPTVPGKETAAPASAAPLLGPGGAAPAAAPVPGTPPTGPAALAGSIEAQLVPVIVRQARLVATGNGHELVLRLQPESLGTVHVRLTLQEDGLSVGLAATNPETHRALEAALPQLRASLIDAGVRLQRLDLGLPDSAGSGEQGGGLGGSGSGGPWNGDSGAQGGRQFGGEQPPPERAFTRMLFDADGRPFSFAAVSAGEALDRPGEMRGIGRAAPRAGSLGAYGARSRPRGVSPEA